MIFPRKNLRSAINFIGNMNTTINFRVTEFPVTCTGKHAHSTILMSDIDNAGQESTANDVLHIYKERKKKEGLNSLALALTLTPTVTLSPNHSARA